MDIGLILGMGDNATVDSIIGEIAGAEKDGFKTVWMANIMAHDAITMLALAGRETSKVELGTAVVPTYPRHPAAMAQQALTASAASGGRFVLGIGRSHKLVIEDMLGLEYNNPISGMREYVTILRALANEGAVAHNGKVYRVNVALSLADGKPYEVMVGALMPKMLELCGELCDGTLTWMTGPKHLASSIVPVMQGAADKAGRKLPRVVCSLPVCVTDNPEAARATAAEAFQIYGQLPVYRACLDSEGAAGPEDIAVIGTEDEVRARLEEVSAAGASDFYAAIFPEDGASKESYARSYEFMKQFGGSL